MTVAVNDTIDRYLIAGVGPYAYTWRIFNDTDLQVYALSAASPPVPTLLTYLTHYTVTGLNVSSGGAITLSAAAAATFAGYTLDIRANTPDDQPTSIRNIARFLPEIHEDAYDYLSRQIQDLRRLVNASVRTPDNELTLPMIVPPVATRAGKYEAYDALGQPIAASGTGNDSALRIDIAATASGSDGARLVGFRRTEAGSSARSVSDKLSDEIHAKDFNAKFDNATNDGTAFDNMLAAAAATISGAQGNQIELPQGTSILSATKNIPNRVSLRGRNKRGTVLKAAAGHSGTYMFTANNGISSMFDNALERLTLDCNDVAGLGGVLSDAWQEGGGLRDVLINKFRTYGVDFANGYGGASLVKIADAEIFGSALGCTAGVRANLTGLTAPFLLDVQRTSITGGGNAGGAGVLPRGIDVVNSSLTCISTHFEVCTSGVYLDGPGNVVLINCTGASGTSAVINLVEVAATFTGTLRMLGCQRNGATNLVKDDRAGGIDIAWDVNDYTLPIISVTTPNGPAVNSPSTAKAWCTFDGTTAGTNAPTAGENVTSVERTGTGRYTITLTRQMLNVNGACIASCANPSLLVGSAAAGAASFTISINNTSLIATDSNEVHAVLFGK